MNFDEWKIEINTILNTSMLLPLTPRLRNHPETARGLIDEVRRILQGRVYASENRAVVLYFEKTLAEVKEIEVDFRVRLLKKINEEEET